MWTLNNGFLFIMQHKAERNQQNAEWFTGPRSSMHREWRKRYSCPRVPFFVVSKKNILIITENIHTFTYSWCFLAKQPNHLDILRSVSSRHKRVQPKEATSCLLSERTFWRIPGFTFKRKIQTNGFCGRSCRNRWKIICNRYSHTLWKTT